GENMREVERVIMLQNVDSKWMEHIDLMDQLRRGISLRAYAQKDPVVEYKYEGMDMFDEMISNIKTDTVKMLMRIQPGAKTERKQVAKPIEASHGEGNPESKTVKVGEKVGRNDPCPCGSGKKYKKCCGQ
ncbi:MAG: SEC-C domain-containing protein, partial [Clostridia bacterium]|nr:SEC-C domain-containing protein [Clostridia bacterium]